MKKLFLLIGSILLSLNSNSCGLPDYYCEEHNKNFLIPHLITNSELQTHLFSSANSHNYKLNYSIYDWERDYQSDKLRKLGFSEDVIYFMNSDIIKSSSVTSYYTKIEFNSNKRTVDDLNISNFFDYKIIKDFEVKGQLEYLKYLMYRSIVLFGGNLSSYTKESLRKYILFEMKTCPNELTADYSTLLIDINLQNNKEIVSDYLKFFENSKQINPIAHSHFSGSVSQNYETEPDIDTLYKDNKELSVYLFTKMLDYPKLYRKTIYEINYVINLKKEFDWEKCLSYCKNQEEKDLIYLIKTSIFSGVNISLIDYFKERTNKKSKTFELALIEYTKRVEANLFTNLYSSGNFKENYISSSEFVNQYHYEDGVDLYNYLKSDLIQNKVLLHLLRGYSSFMLGKFSEAKKEYKTSRDLIKTSNYLTKKQKTNFYLQLDGLDLLKSFCLEYSERDYNTQQKRLTKFLKRTYLSGKMETYFQLGMQEAIKAKDFITAFFYTSEEAFHQEILLDVMMDNDELDKLLTKLNTEEIPFIDRIPSDIKQAVIEQIATNYYRDNNLLKSQEYFDLLSENIFKPSTGGKEYYSYRSTDFYSNFEINVSETDKKINKKYNKKTHLNTVLELSKEIEGKINTLSSSDSIEVNLLRAEISNLYSDLSTLYNTPFWGYSRFWKGYLYPGIYYSNSFPFNNLDSNYYNNKIETYLNKYGTKSKSIEYLKKAIEFSDNKENQAKLNYRLLKKLDKPFYTSFHKKIYKKDKLNLILNKYKTDSSSTVLLIDSVLRNTNYFNEVISECGIFRKDKSGNNDIILDSSKESNIESNDSNRKLLSTFLLIFMIVIGLFIFKKNDVLQY